VKTNPIQSQTKPIFRLSSGQVSNGALLKSQKIQVFALTGAGRQVKGLHPLIAWSAAAFRSRPADIIEGTLYLACLTVQTV